MATVTVPVGRVDRRAVEDAASTARMSSSATPARIVNVCHVAASNVSVVGGAAGVVVTWVPWLVLFASLPFARRTMDGPMSDAMFAGMTSFGLVVPSVVVASGLAIFVRRATAKTLVGSWSSC